MSNGGACLLEYRIFMFMCDPEHGCDLDSSVTSSAVPVNSLLSRRKNNNIIKYNRNPNRK